ncbi:unnamed protein product [Closterium sp. Naga37s-1]|nr:unnamed protein product [Closterium sp. Naga37s-1]
MALQQFLGLSFLFLLVTACFATLQTESPVKDDAKAPSSAPLTDFTSNTEPIGSEKRKPTGAAPCPLPDEEKSLALGNLTAILAARLNGSEVVGSTGDVNATGRICLAVFEFDGEFNVFYHALVSTSKPGAPTSAFVALGTAGKAGPIVLKIAGAKAKWTNKTRLPPPFLLIDKTNNPPPPMYTYAFKGTWLNASRIPNASIGKSVKSVVNLLKSKTNSYYGGFSTASFTAGAARGQFKSEPLPLVGVMEAQLRAFNLHEIMEPDFKAKGCVSLAVFRLHSLLPSPYTP